MSMVAWTAGIVLGMLGLLAAGLVLFTAWTARQQ